MTDPEIDKLVKLQIMIEGMRAAADPAHVGLIGLYEEMLKLTEGIKIDADALLVVARAVRAEKADTVHTEGVDWVYGDKEQAVRDALADLPEHLK